MRPAKIVASEHATSILIEIYRDKSIQLYTKKTGEIPHVIG